MTLSATNFILKQYLKTRQWRISNFCQLAHECQQKILDTILENNKDTAWGKKYKYAQLNSRDAFKAHIPIQRYEQLYPWIQKMIDGEQNILTREKVDLFARSSGTSNDESKYIPVSKSMLSAGHDTASWDLLSTIYHLNPEIKIFQEKNLIMGGSLSSFDHNPEMRYGDISAITLNNLPAFSRPYYTPDFETALLPDWEEKIDRMVIQCSQESITMFAGVPTWTIVLFNKILEYTGKNNMLEVWPEANVYIHGGVGFEPYRKIFDNYFPGDQLCCLEVYNASEGFFAYQDSKDNNDLLLLVDHGIYFEFIPIDSLQEAQPITVALDEVQIGKRYSMVITTLSGLTRYRLGDIIQFTSTDPYRIKVAGREQQYINVFGEEMMIHNTDSALAKSCKMFGVEVSEYTVAPIYLTDESKGGHQWLIEFYKAPKNLKTFSRYLDACLQELNSDYKAKRSGDLALTNLEIQTVPTGTFHLWMKSKGKLGHQNKVPRLSNTRNYIDDILNFTSSVPS